MAFHVENIGLGFTDKDIQALTARLNQRQEAGWEFHSVFEVEHRTCLGLMKTRTYLAVYKSAA